MVEYKHLKLAELVKRHNTESKLGYREVGLLIWKEVVLMNGKRCQLALYKCFKQFSGFQGNIS